MSFGYSHNRNFGPNSRVIRREDDHYVYFEDGTYALRSFPARRAEPAAYQDPFWTPQIAVAPKANDRYWQSVTMNSASQGTVSLAETAILVLLRHPYMLSAEALVNVPWEIGRQLWQRLITTSGLTLNIWRIFMQAYASEEDLPRSLQSFYQTLEASEASNLDLDFQRITSRNCAWLTSLTLQSIAISRISVFRAIPNITNLVSVELKYVSFDDGSQLDDRVLQKWARAAQGGNFKFLQLMGFYHQEHVTTRAVSFLNEFPSLWMAIFGGLSLEQHRAEAYLDPEKRWTHTSTESQTIIQFLKQQNSRPQRRPCSSWPRDDLWMTLKRLCPPGINVGIPEGFTPAILSLSVKTKDKAQFYANRDIVRCHCAWESRDLNNTDLHPRIKVYTRQSNNVASSQPASKPQKSLENQNDNKKRRAEGKSTAKRPVKRLQEGRSMLQAFGII